METEKEEDCVTEISVDNRGSSEDEMGNHNLFSPVFGEIYVFEAFSSVSTVFYSYKNSTIFM